MTPRLLAGLRRASWTLAGQLLIALPAYGAPTASEKAAAEALFNEGTELMSQENFGAACSKFEASSAIESGLGVKLWLADCYDRAGRTASAWALFSEAASLAHQSGQAERERAASERAVELEGRLSKLALEPPPAGLPKGLVVTLNGAKIPVASLGSALPVDPGPQRVVLRAPAYRELVLETLVPSGPGTVKLAVPQLKREPAAQSVQVDRSTAVEPSSPGATQRTLGYAVGGLGLLSFAGAGVLAYHAHSLDQDSRAHCLVDEPNACDVEGASLREQARTFGNVATGLLAAGGALSVTGVVLLLTAPRGAPPPKVGLNVGFLPGVGLMPGGASVVATGSL